MGSLSTHGCAFDLYPFYDLADSPSIRITNSESGICVGAFIPLGQICETLFATPFTTPFLHIYGKHDVVVLEERTERVIELNNSSSKRVETHIGGICYRIYVVCRAPFDTRVLRSLRPQFAALEAVFHRLHQGWLREPRVCLIALYIL